jgi:hypothetical protein
MSLRCRSDQHIRLDTSLTVGRKNASANVRPSSRSRHAWNASKVFGSDHCRNQAVSVQDELWFLALSAYHVRKLLLRLCDTPPHSKVLDAFHV